MRFCAILVAALLFGLNSNSVAAAQEAPAPLSDLQRIQADRFVQRYLSATTDGDRATALKLANSLPPLTARDAETLLGKVKRAVRLHGSKYRGAGDGTEDGVITLPDYPDMKGRYRVQGRLDGSGTPLFVGLHGGGATGGDSSRAVKVFRDVHANSVQVYPTAMKLEADAWNSPREERYVLALIDEMVRTYDIDTNRIYLAGTSMGGFGAWSMGTAHPDRFAALASGAGGVIPMRRGGKLTVQPGWVENLYSLPIWFYHSADDPRVPPHGDRVAHRALKMLQGKFPEGYPHIYKEYTDRGHGAPPMGHRPILQWMFGQRRDPAPKRVRWRPCRSYKRQCYWLYWPELKLEGRRSATGPMIDARIGDGGGGADDGANTITVSGAPKGLELFLRPGMVDLSKPVELRITGRQTTTQRVSQTLTAMLISAGESRDPELVFTARLPVTPPR